MRRAFPLAVLLAPILFLPAAPDPRAADAERSMLGGTAARNMVNLTAAGLSPEFPRIRGPEGESIWVLGHRVKWKATLGSRSYGGPTVVGDRILVGTNNENPRNKRDRAKPVDDDPEGRPLDRGIVMCFRASDGAFLWQMVHDKLVSGQVNDWPREGICSTPAIEADRAYYVSNRAEVVCLDLNGFANGNDGFQEEKYRDPADGDVIWSFDMMKELKVFPHNMANCSPLIVGDLVFVTTTNGVDENHVRVPFPDAPSFLCLSKHTGKLIWKSNLPGNNIMHSQWSSPAYAVIGGRPQVIFAGGDGWLYAFEPDTGRLIWKFDCNPKDAKYELGGKGTKSDFIALPVVYKERVFIGTGQDPEHLEGIGHFWCIDPAGKEGDISPDLVADPRTEPPGTKVNPNSGLVWHYGGNETRPHAKRDYLFSRTMSTACIADDIVYIAELAGYVQCLDARTGRKYWQWDTKSSIWGSCYYVDGKVLVANEDGDLYVFRHDKTPQVLDEAAEGARAALEAEKKARAGGFAEADIRKTAHIARDEAIAAVREKVATKYLLEKVEIGEAIRSTPVMANDTLYLMTEKTLYAIKAKAR
jgi:outer membrane protein assembly factor BamB